jgi:CheY-like chemotaxis protein
MTTLARILIVEDDPKDVELTLTALEEYNLANEVAVTRDGQDTAGVNTAIAPRKTLQSYCLT